MRHLRFNQSDHTDFQKLRFPRFRGKTPARISTILKEDDREGNGGGTMRKPMKLADADILAASLSTLPLGCLVGVLMGAVER